MANLPSVPEYFAELNKAAEVSIEISKPLKWYLRSTELVFKQACVYLSEGDNEKAFVLLMKYSNLMLSQLPRHPEYNATEHAAQKTKLRKQCVKAIETLEKLKPILEESYVNLVEQHKLAIASQAAQAEAQRQQHEEQEALARFRALQQKSEPAQETAPAPIAQTEPNSAVAPPVQVLASQPSIDIPPSGSYPSLPILTQPEVTQPPVTLPQRAQPKYFSESGRPLRPVHVPESIISKFLAIASQNTQRNIETCGIIVGKLHKDEFTVTCLIIPKQEGTSDTCHMTNEEEMVDVQDRLDVMSLGWIHTHPTQSCFMSSVDLHTHMPFQMLMEEAIAIVCAPTKSPNFGIFRLTDPPGLDLIKECRHSGFHKHPEHVQIYRELKGPESHAQMASGLPLEIIDLRNK